jgi:hypothetical protein
MPRLTVRHDACVSYTGRLIAVRFLICFGFFSCDDTRPASRKLKHLILELRKISVSFQENDNASEKRIQGA